MFKTIREQAKVVYERDPAARNTWETLLCHRGTHAILFHRLSNWFWRNKFKLLARFISNLSCWFTGVDIHPAATIGRGFFIDHGTGIVIGETSEIGNNVSIYQGVTLGGTSWERKKRHPTIEDNVVVGAGAKILGPIRIGHDSKVGANSVVTKDVPPFSTVVGIPGKPVHRAGQIVGEHYDLEHGELPDPEMKLITHLQKQINTLESRLKKLEGEKGW